MKARDLLLVILSCALIWAGCSATNDESTEKAIDNNEDTTKVTEDVTTEQESEEEVSETATESSEDDRSDIGNLEIWIGGEVTVEEDQVTIEGESNILPGAQITSGGISDGWASIDYQGGTKTQDDGSFYFEFPGRNSDIVVDLKLSTINEHVTNHYGENLEKATGHQIYTTDTHGEYEAKATFTIDASKEMPYTIELETPDWSNVPSDYGDPNVWMEAEHTIEHNYVYFDVKSNLVEGSHVGGNLRNKSGGIEPFSYDYTRVNPDGSFKLQVHYWDLREGMYMPIHYKPDRNSWDDVIDAYGEVGEKLKGNLVQKDDEGEKFAVLKVMLDAPDISPPEEIDLSLEEEEIKMQVPDDLLFDFDESKLKSEAKETLDEIINDLDNLVDGTEIQINGHTDNVGEADYNLNLSEERANAVADYVKKHSNLDTLHIQIQGFGDTSPIASNEDKEGKKKNRRVEIVINPR